MTIYEVVTFFYDSGRVDAHFHTYELDKKPDNKYIERPRFDRYHDYFTNKKEAEKHFRNAKRA